jgi:adenylate kinase family enzyme
VPTATGRYRLPMRRIVVYGVTGSGKSTLAGRIGARLGLPYHAVDDLTWEPGWVEVSAEEQRKRMSEVCAGDAWVIDSMYGKWLDIPLARTDLIVGLDMPRWRSLSRLVRRTVTNIVVHRPLCNNNYESWRTFLSRDSIVAWHFASFKRKQRRMRGWHADPAFPETVLLRSPTEVERWLDGLERGQGRTDGSAESTSWPHSH